MDKFVPIHFHINYSAVCYIETSETTEVSDYDFPFHVSVYFANDNAKYFFMTKVQLQELLTACGLPELSYGA